MNKENNPTLPPPLHYEWKEDPLPSQTTPCPCDNPLQTEGDEFGQDVLSRSPGLPPSILQCNSYEPQLPRNLQHNFSQEETSPSDAEPIELPGIIRNNQVNQDQKVDNIQNNQDQAYREDNNSPPQP